MTGEHVGLDSIAAEKPGMFSANATPASANQVRHTSANARGNKSTDVSPGGFHTLCEFFTPANRCIVLRWDPYMHSALAVDPQQKTVLPRGCTDYAVAKQRERERERERQEEGWEGRIPSFDVQPGVQSGIRFEEYVFPLCETTESFPEGSLSANFPSGYCAPRCTLPKCRRKSTNQYENPSKILSYSFLLHVGEENRDGASARARTRSAWPTTGTEIENRFVHSLEHCESSRGPSALPSTSYCFHLNNILNNTLCAFHLDHEASPFLFRVSPEIYEHLEQHRGFGRVGTRATKCTTARTTVRHISIPRREQRLFPPAAPKEALHTRFHSQQYGPRDAILMTLAGSDGANYFGKQNMPGTGCSEEKQGALRRFLIYAL
ncbi:hypothetical protein ALC62_10836 [Cyphomyrmex costatus]|uniref:Uncharacterized protein n=1 Tax=Cyphomyrmex costatus TaxID=456900 RepID=A0A195CC97_9HYME|nr:hypothetical protein ALC62_10836 [Cyphomyrmex costatus]